MRDVRARAPPGGRGLHPGHPHRGVAPHRAAHGAAALSTASPAAGKKRRTAGLAALFFLGLTALLVLPALREPAARIIANIDHPGVQGELFHQWDFLEHARGGDLRGYARSRNVSYPDGQDLSRFIGFSLHLFFYLPLLLVRDPVVAFNILALIALALNGWCAFLLARHLTRSTWPALAGGVLFLLSPYALLKLEQGFLQKIILWWIPLFALSLIRFLERRRKRDAAIAGLFWALMLLTYAVYAWYALLFGAVFVAAAWLKDHRVPRDLLGRGWPFLLTAAPAVLLLAAVLPAGGFDPELGPGGVPFAIAAAPAGSLDPLHPLRSFPYRGFIPEVSDLPLGVSLLALVLAGAALVKQRPGSVVMATAAALFLVLAVGPFPHTGGDLAGRIPLPYYFLARHLPWGERLGFSLRALPFAEIALASLAALALGGRMKKSGAAGGGRHALSAVGLILALAIERRLVLPEIFPPVITTATLSPELAWLQREGGAILHLPADTAGHNPKEYGAIAARTGTPMLNPYTPPQGGFPDPPLPDPAPAAMAAYLGRLNEQGCRFILIHPRLLAPGEHTARPGKAAALYTLADTEVLRTWCGPPVWNDRASLVAYRVPAAAEIRRVLAALPDPGEEARGRFLLLAEARRLALEAGEKSAAPATGLPGELLIERLLATRVHPKVRVADAELPVWYEDHRGEFTRPDQIRVHHFFVPRPSGSSAAAERAARAEAQRLLREASGDVSNSFALAEELTRRDPLGRRWGDIGYFSRGTFPAPVDDALFALRRFGETALVELSDGFHVFRLMDIRPGRQYAFAEVVEAVRERATREARARATREFAVGLAAREDAADMVYVPGGYFWMGSTAEEIDRAWQMAKRFAGRTREVRREWFEDEEHRPVRVRPFLMDRHEVTVDQYRAFLRATGRQPPPGWEGAPAEGRQPVTGVSWEDARAYAAWAGKRLPSAEEWEWAARGASRRWFPWGDGAPDGSRANYADAGTDLPWNDREHDDGNTGAAPVGSYPAGATPEGILDLAGNAREWTATPRQGIVDPADHHIWDAAQRDLVPGGEELPAVEMYAVKGGSWDGAADDLRASDARLLPPGTRHRALGFRCAGDIP